MGADSSHDAFYMRSMKQAGEKKKRIIETSYEMKRTGNNDLTLSGHDGFYMRGMILQEKAFVETDSLHFPSKVDFFSAMPSLSYPTPNTNPPRNHHPFSPVLLFQSLFVWFSCIVFCRKLPPPRGDAAGLSVTTSHSPLLSPTKLLPPPPPLSHEREGFLQLLARPTLPLLVLKERERFGPRQAAFGESVFLPEGPLHKAS